MKSVTSSVNFYRVKPRLGWGQLALCKIRNRSCHQSFFLRYICTAPYLPPSTSTLSSARYPLLIFRRTPKTYPQTSISFLTTDEYILPIIRRQPSSDPPCEDFTPESNYSPKGIVFFCTVEILFYALQHHLSHQIARLITCHCMT